MLLRAGVEVAELHAVVQVAVVDVRRIVRVQGLGRRSGLVRRVVDDHRRVADRPRAQEELLVLALDALPHRTDAEPVGDDLGADAAGAVVDREPVPHAVEGVREDGVLVLVEPLRERLDGLDLVVEDDRELAERLLASVAVLVVVLVLPVLVGVRPHRDRTSLRAGDDRVQVRVHDVARVVEHVEDREPAPAVAGPDRVLGVVVDHRMPVGGRDDRSRVVRGGQIHVRPCDLAAVPLGVPGLDVDRAEQAESDRRVPALAADRRAERVQEVRVLVLGEERVGVRTARLHEAALVLADERAVVGDVVERTPSHLHPVDVDPDVAVGRMVRLLLPGGRQQVLERDLEAVADVHAQHERSRPLAGAQLDVARHGSVSNRCPRGVGSRR